MVPIDQITEWSIKKIIVFLDFYSCVFLFLTAYAHIDQGYRKGTTDSEADQVVGAMCHLCNLQEKM